jgi:hypothetical protein
MSAYDIRLEQILCQPAEESPFSPLLHNVWLGDDWIAKLLKDTTFMRCDCLDLLSNESHPPKRLLLGHLSSVPKA